MAKSKLSAATGIRDCLDFLLDETIEAELEGVGLHVRLAIMEADDAIQKEKTLKRDRRRAKQA